MPLGMDTGPPALETGIAAASCPGACATRTRPASVVSPVGGAPVRFYIASKLENAAAVRALASRLVSFGWTWTYDWTAHGSVQDSGPERIREVAVAEAVGVTSADLVIVLLPGGRGTHAELGIAIGHWLAKCSPEVAIFGTLTDGDPNGRECAFYRHDAVIARLPAMDADAIALRLLARQRNGGALPAWSDTTPDAPVIEGYPRCLSVDHCNENGACSADPPCVNGPAATATLAPVKARDSVSDMDAADHTNRPPDEPALAPPPWSDPDTDRPSPAVTSKRCPASSGGAGRCYNPVCVREGCAPQADRNA
jgi:hypothetical protein